MPTTIEIKHLLPRVFRGMEGMTGGSQIWLTDSFVFRKGCKICIHAESGGGKSSLLSFIFGNRHDYDGTILMDGKDIRTFGTAEWCGIRTRGIALLPQEMRLFPELTVMQNIMLKNNLTGHKTEAEIVALLTRLGIESKADRPVATLSIGQQQRVALIRTVCQPFDFIFLDEPVSHLDEANNRIVAAIVEEEASRQGAGIISTSVGNHLLLNNPQFVSL